MAYISATGNPRGIALLAALFLVLAVSLLGMTALQLAVQEIDSARALRDDAASLHLAEAGTDVVLGWIHAPGSIPSEDLRHVLMKREGAAGEGASYFDSEGRSQFRGSADRPDVWFDAKNPEHDVLLNDPSRGWFRALAGMGKITALKVYAPTRPDLLCTVEVAAVGPSASEDEARTVRLQLAAVPMPPLRTAVRVGALPPSGGTASSVLVHWGEAQIVGDASVKTVGDLPVRSSLAAVTGQSYREMPVREDRWHELKIGGNLTVLQPQPHDQSLPLNVSQHQIPVPGLKLNQWDYAQLKRLAQTYGAYYVPDREGRLHLGGLSNGDPGLRLDEVMRARSVGEGRGLVFVDTLDQQPPGADNLSRLVAETSYAEGVFVVNAHVLWRPRGSGVTLPALTPPTPGGTSVASRVPVQLSDIHLNGVLAVTGNLVIEESLRVFGAVISDGTVATTGTGLEVWFNHDLGSGLYRGLPVVRVAPGTWRSV